MDEQLCLIHVVWGDVEVIQFLNSVCSASASWLKCPPAFSNKMHIYTFNCSSLDVVITFRSCPVLFCDRIALLCLFFVKLLLSHY
jgi:hypothetical protein